MLIASIDTTERYKLEQTLAAQAQQLEAQNEALKENVRLREEVERIGRHDMKTPLNSILAVPRLLRDGRTMTKEITLAAPQVFDFRIEEDLKASAEKKALRAAWMNGK